MNIGVLGGTFDPVHEGHIFIARRAVEIFALDQVLFMVSGDPPHKGRDAVTDGYHRFAMTALATADDPRLLVSADELHRPGPSYTVDTLRSLRLQRPGESFCFLAGGDSLKELHLWKDCDTLLTEFCFVFLQRSGVGADLGSLPIARTLRKRIRLVCEKEKPSIQPGVSFLVITDPPRVSSTQIRASIAGGGSPGAEELSPLVLRHIRKYRLYEQHERRPGQGLPGHRQ